MSAPGIFRLPQPKNEPVHGYAPGSPERAALQAKLAELESERIDLPLVIGGEEIRTGNTAEVVMPHRTSHVLADVHQGGPTEVEQGDQGGRAAWHDWSRTPWEERAAVLLRAAELLAGPWRATLNAATMLGQSKIGPPGRDRRGLRAHRLLALQPDLHDPHLRGAADLLAGVSGTGWSTGRSRASSSR